MNTQKLSAFIIGLMIVTLLFVSCATPATSTPTPVVPTITPLSPSNLEATGQAATMEVIMTIQTKLTATAEVIAKYTPTSTATLPPILPGKLTASEVRSIAADFKNIAERLVDSWNTHDIDIILRQYNDDLYITNSSSIGFSGIAELRIGVTWIFAYYPDFEGRLVDTYIGRKDGLVAWHMWNYYGFTKDNPTTEYDLLTARNGRISTWTVLSAPELLNALGAGGTINKQLLTDFGSAWSTGDPEAVARLYAGEAVREDSLFMERNQGRDAIKAFAENYFTWHPNVQMELLQPLGENAPGKGQGGIYAIHVSDENGEPCDVRALVLLKLSDEGIVRERIYYDAESLITCGWAR